MNGLSHRSVTQWVIVMVVLLGFWRPARTAADETVCNTRITTSTMMHHRHALTGLGEGDLWSSMTSDVIRDAKGSFDQGSRFEVFFIVAAALAVIGLIALQMRHMAAKLRDRLEVRHAERERIARELHDTLLQSIQGLILRFQAIAEHVPPNDPIRVMIDQALDRADEVLVDGRDRVRDLRLSESSSTDLEVTFAALGKELTGTSVATFRVVSSGTRVEIEPIIREEIYLIGREALLNAFQHAQAKAIEVELSYGLKQLRLCVRDDGIGIDPHILEAGNRPGHWGLVGMRERANCIGGQVVIWARQGSGTDVELIVPASVAYARRGIASWKSLKRMLSFGREA